MRTRISAPNRREVLAGLGASLGASLGATVAGLAAAGAGPLVTAQLALQARAATLALRPGQPPTPIWELTAVSHLGDVRLKRFDNCQVVFRNDLPVPLAPVWYGLSAPAVTDQFRGRAPVAPDATETSMVSIPNAGTLLADFRLFEDGLKQPARPLPIIATESSRVPVDRDVILLIEEWRLRPDGTAIPAGRDPKDTAVLYTINGKTSFELSASAGERLRLRFINGSQRSVLAIKLENHEVQVVALDGQPAEPFPARNGALVLAPGARADAFVDAATSAPFLLHDGKQAQQVGTLTISGRLERPPLLPPQPLPPNDLPEKLDLKGALRFDVALGAPDLVWARPATFSVNSAPAFRARTARTVVLALKNPAPIATVFHLHGHHFRLLDKLDDGWKPYWLDTLAIEPGQTQRIAFAATSPGRWLLESVVTDWAAPRLVRWYAVE
ncbi:multicopper oxidase domain-containing protein [Bradyrhizobium sp. BR 10289]|uniref:multicopper oxidase domain-containing protein n=1 Tax=Bradyrhizobium sp. BR 10289 TaxID=2749993 RepID=UPI001C65285C|nr:multicopper oxidase domain-containing protein [Bradyrhizobium sp. BR 10289]MBW7968900.1 multicopper oxidase domain-containing protein [Bradyrhizobium sp. BR 10289]